MKRITGKNIAIWGLSFKPNTDDIRFAPSVDIIKALLEKGYSISVYDQEGMKNIQRLFGNKLMYAKNSYDSLVGADALVILTEWNEFKHIDLVKVKKLLKTPMIFDGRNIYDLQKMKEMGFTYISTGRAPVSL